MERHTPHKNDCEACGTSWEECQDIIRRHRDCRDCAVPGCCPDCTYADTH